ncbi:MAG: acyltransferase [candidate division Zixibacteria bacterium]|nr:acyltransferase [candidate division Zixibacteria bacterium]
MQAGFVQMKPEFGKKETNLKKALRLMDKATSDLLVLPELFDTGYAFSSREELAALAEPFDKSETVSELKKYSRETKTVVIAGIAEKDKGKIYNSAITILPNGRKHVYRKLHLFYKEKLYFNRGNGPLEVISYKGMRIGVMICFDWIFPETARTLALKGANIICHPSNLVLSYCQNAMVTRCLENRVFSITCNRVGNEDRGGNSYNFTGFSRVIAPNGNVLAEGSKVKEELKAVDINLKGAEDKRITSLNDIFEDRRIKFYNIKGKK